MAAAFLESVPIDAYNSLQFYLNLKEERSVWRLKCLSSNVHNLW